MRKTLVLIVANTAFALAVGFDVAHGDYDWAAGSALYWIGLLLIDRGSEPGGGV